MTNRQWYICLTLLAVCLCNLLDCPRLEIVCLLAGVSCVAGTQKIENYRPRPRSIARAVSA